jgi:chaperonin cofactor prefoldin
LARLFDENHRLYNEIHHYRDEAQQLHDRNDYLELFVTLLKARLMAIEEVIAQLQEALNKKPPPVAPRRQ